MSRSRLWRTAHRDGGARTTGAEAASATAAASDWHEDGAEGWRREQRDGGTGRTTWVWFEFCRVSLTF
ncbi:hypothetical protein SESBI_10379 [Sesbania bispinosa]|nr:hypothetical protein SESBI_10379 [Sesbania bispinosa]